MQYSELFSEFPVLETDRLLLRHITPKDAMDIFIMRSDPEVMRYIPRPMAKEVNDVFPLIDMLEGFLIKGERINWAMELKETKQVVGMIGFVNIKPDHFRAEVGYSLARAFHRKGIMREALKKVLEYGFNEMILHSIEAIIDAENDPSGALLLNVGFRQEAYFKEDFYYNGSFRNSIHFGLLRSEMK